MRLPVNVDFITVSPGGAQGFDFGFQKPVYHYGPSRSPRGRTQAREKSCYGKGLGFGRRASTSTKGNLSAICTLEQAQS